jgi:hypothetical protein
MATKEHALGISKVLGELDRKNYNLWDKLTPEEQKGFSSFITLWWMAGTTNQRQLVFLNEIVNMSIFKISEDKEESYRLKDKEELMMKLLAICSSGKKEKYTWINYKLKHKKSKRSVELIAEHYGMSLKDAEDTLRLFSPEEIMELAELHGFQKDELKLLKKEVGA